MTAPIDLNTPFDLATDEGVLLYATLLMAHLKNVHEKLGGLPSGIVCIATCYDGQRFSSPTPVTVVDDGALEGKGALSGVFHQAARACGSLGVFFFSETWSVDFDSRAEFDLWSERDLSQHPRAYENLYCSLEHRTLGCRSWKARISRDASGRGTPAEFDFHAEQFQGRFARFLDYVTEATS